MNKKPKSSIYHFENYIQMQKLNFLEPKKLRHSIRSKETRALVKAKARSGNSV